MVVTGDVSRVLGMNVNRDREKGKITAEHKYYTEDIVQRFGMKDCSVAFTRRTGRELSLN